MFYHVLSKWNKRFVQLPCRSCWKLRRLQRSFSILFPQPGEHRIAAFRHPSHPFSAYPRKLSVGSVGPENVTRWESVVSIAFHCFDDIDFQSCKIEDNIVNYWACDTSQIGMAQNGSSITSISFGSIITTTGWPEATIHATVGMWYDLIIWQCCSQHPKHKVEKMNE